MNKSSVSAMLLSILVLVASLIIVQVQCGGDGDTIIMGHEGREGDVIKHGGKKGDLIVFGHKGKKGYGKKSGNYIKHEGKGDLILN